MSIAGEMTANDVQRFGLCKGALDLFLLLHLCRVNKMLKKVQLYFGVLGRARPRKPTTVAFL